MTREEAIQILEQRLSAAKYLDYSYIDCVDAEALEMAIEALKEPERKKGKWKVVSDGYGNGEATACICECSECKDTIWVYKKADRKWNFCPNCGAEMEEK